MTTWPISIPQAPLADGGFSFAQVDQRVITAMDVGPPKMRRRYSKKIENAQCRFLMTRTDALTFKTFYEDDLAGCSLPFTWVHPLTGDAISCRILETPQMDAAGINWNISFKVEIQYV